MAEAAVRELHRAASADRGQATGGRFLYVLPHQDFFWPGLTGQVAHAQGILQGAQDEFDTVTLLSAPAGRELLAPSGDRVSFEDAGRPGAWWTVRFMRRLMSLRRIADFIVIRSEPRFLFLLAILKRVTRGWPVTCVEVNGLGFSFVRHGGGNQLLIACVTLVYRVLLHACDVVYVVNSDLARRLTTGMARLPAERVVVVHNGGPEQRFLVHRDVERTELHVFFFGLLHPYNDFACLLDAAAQVRASGVPVVVHVAGEGSERGYLESRQEGDSLRLYGQLSRDEFAEIVRAAPGKRVGIACMRFGNGSGSVSPLKVFDYLALGMPVLYSDNILRDVLVDGEHGLAYRERDPRSLGEAMVQVLETSTYERMSASVRELYPAYTWSSRIRLLAAALRRHV